MEKKKIKERLPGIRQISMDFAGVDPIEEPIPVQPGQHYSMGGIASSPTCETPLKGFYAAGECACVSVHGANRLGGNSLLETIVFGKIAGEMAAQYVKNAHYGSDSALEDGLRIEKEKIETLLKRDSGEPIYQIREELKKVMFEKVGIFRLEKEMQDCLEKIKELKERYKNIYCKNKGKVFNYELINALELEGMLDIAEVICKGAIKRKESRGSHYRIDYPEREDENWLKHTLAYYTPDGPDLKYKEVTITMFEPKKREY